MAIFSSAVAKDLAMQVVNVYLTKHGLPTLAAGVVVTPTVKRVQNKIRQATYRDTHTRFTEWRNNDNATILNHYQERLQALRVAKKAYRAALSIYAKKVYGLGLDPPTATAAQVAAALVVKDAKEAIFNAAQLLSYTGDGTTL